MRLARRTSVVTGAASGIGKAIAQAFVREGAAVAVLDVNRAKGESVAADLNRQGRRWDSSAANGAASPAGCAHTSAWPS